MSNGDGEHDEGIDVISAAEQRVVKQKIDEKEELREASGVTGATSKAAGSVLKQLITVNDDRRQLLALANFESKEEAGNVSACIKEAKRYGVPDDSILDLISAYMGVCSQNLGRIEWGVQALTHLDINQPSKNKFSWRGKPKEEEKPT